MRTRTLLLLAVTCGLAILVAGTVQLLRLAGQETETILAVGDAGTARVRLVNLDTGNLVYSSYPSEFNGQTPEDVGSLGGTGSSRLQITDNWVERMVKPLFEKQR